MIIDLTNELKDISEFEGINIIVETYRGANFRLKINGVEPEKISKGKYKIVDNNQNERILKIKTKSFYDYYPILYIDDKKINDVEPLNLVQKVFIFIPLILLFMGGAIGGALGAMAMIFNGITFRQKEGKIAYLFAILNTIFAVLIYMVIASAFVGTFK